MYEIDQLHFIHYYSDHWHLVLLSVYYGLEEEDPTIVYMVFGETSL